MQLAQLGSATGVYKTLVRYLVGVPQVSQFFGVIFTILTMLVYFLMKNFSCHIYPSFFEGSCVYINDMLLTKCRLLLEF